MEIRKSHLTNHKKAGEGDKKYILENKSFRNEDKMHRVFLNTAQHQSDIDKRGGTDSKTTAGII